MDINYLLFKNKMTKYQLVKLSGVPHSTIFDICSYKTLLRNCSAITVAKIAKVFNMTVDELLFTDMSTTLANDFESFKSTILHNLNAMKSDIEFLNDLYKNNDIEFLYKKHYPLESFYLLALADYLSRINNLPINKDYDELRMHKLDEMKYPLDCVLFDKINNTDAKCKNSLRKSIPEFLSYNIVEVNVRNVV